MRRVGTFYRSTIGKKIVMAVSGVVLVGFVLGHMVGNLKAFQGAEKIDAYAEFLRDMGSPIFGHGQVLWLVRIVLILALVAHVVAAIQLSRVGWGARSQSYRRALDSEASTYASRSMRVGGVVLLVFVIYHLLHMTTGTVHPDFVVGGVYHNLQAAFSSWVVAAVYVLAMLALGMHLYHGVWSGFQTLGINHERLNAYRRPLAVILAILIALGFVAVPVAFFSGVLS